MEGYFGEIRVRTGSRIEFKNITSDVRRIVEESGVRSGIATIYTPHTTTAIFVNEDESGLKGDLMKVLEKLIPVEGGYEHDLVDDNAFAHLRSIIVNPSITIPIRDGRLMLGTWQSIFIAEFDGPRTRTVYVQVLGFR